MFQHEGISFSIQRETEVIKWILQSLHLEVTRERQNFSSRCFHMFSYSPSFFQVSPFCFPELDLVTGDWWRWHVAALLDPLLDLRVRTNWHISCLCRLIKLCHYVLSYSYYDCLRFLYMLTSPLQACKTLICQFYESCAQCGVCFEPLRFRQCTTWYVGRVGFWLACAAGSWRGLKWRVSWNDWNSSRSWLFKFEE